MNNEFDGKEEKSGCAVIYVRYCPSMVAGIAHSVYRLSTGWTVRGSNPGGGEIFRAGVGRPRGPHRLPYSGYRVLLEGKAAGAWC